MTNAADRLIVALDVPDPAQARDIVAELDGLVSFYKVGFWLLFTPGGEGLIDWLVASGKRVFLDAKFYDIGETVRRGVEALARRGISIVTVHGDPAIMRAAAEGRGDSGLKLFAITMLTSLDDAAAAEMGYALSVKELVAKRVRSAVDCGLDGVIASPFDNPAHLKTLGGNPRLLVATPGIRPRGTATDDHARHASPAEAVANGADFLIVGRPILNAPQGRRVAAEAIIGEMGKAKEAVLF